MEPAPVESVAKKPTAGATYIWGTGRRKTAVARVRIRPGDGKFMVNKRDVDEFFHLQKDRAAVRQPLVTTDTGKSYDVFVNVRGGGTSGQAGAVMLGLARALIKADRDLEAKLRESNLLTRDPRKVERKKYGQRGARRRFQFSKR
jgi:small subunit ribosomal protein S9